MKIFRRLAAFGKGKKKHTHIAYISPDEGSGLVSLNEDHTHEVFYEPPMPAQLDEMGNILVPEIPGRWVVSPGPDGHVHALEEIRAQVKEKKEDDEELLKLVYGLADAAITREAKSLEKGRESEDFYTGKHWDDATKDKLASLDRACLTINLIQKNIDTLCGFQREQRADIKYLPMEGGDQRVADLLNVVVKHITERCYFDREEAETFLDQVVVGRGNFNIYVDFSSDLRGRIVIEKFPWDEVFFGPHEKADLSDCEYLVKSKWFSKEKIKQLWPKKAEEIDGRFSQLEMTSGTDGIQFLHDNYRKSNDWAPVTLGGSYPLLDIARKEIRVLELWQKVYKTVDVITDPSNDVYESAEGWKAEDIESVKTIPGLFVIPRQVTRMRIVKCAGGGVLSDENPADLPEDDFFIVPVYAHKRGEEFWGKVEIAKDPQREINKRHSQAVDVMNKMASYVWFTDETTFPDREEERFQNYASMPGAVFKVNDTNRLPARVEGVKFPGEIVQLMEVGHARLDEIMHVAVESQGERESAQSLLQRQKMRMVGNEYLFDNLSFAKRKIGRLLLKLIQRYWPPERIARLVLSQATKNPDMMMGGQPVADFTEEDIITLLKTTDLGEYDVVVTEASFSPTARLANFLLLSDLAKSGLPIPPESLINLADIPDGEKQKLMSQMAQQQEAMASAESEKSQTEINKTLIGQGIIPPSVQEQLGQQSPQAQMQGQIPMDDTFSPPSGGVGEAAPEQIQAPQQQQGSSQSPNYELLFAVQQIVESINRQQPSVPPININVDASKPKRQQGRILRDEMGNAIVDVQEVPEPPELL